MLVRVPRLYSRNPSSSFRRVNQKSAGTTLPYKNEIQPGRIKKDFYNKQGEIPEDSAKTAAAVPYRNEEEDLQTYAERDEPSEEVQPARQLDMTNMKEQILEDPYEEMYEPKVVHETTLRNYRIKNQSRLKPMER